MYAILSSFFNLVKTSFPMSLLETSEEPLFLSIDSISSVAFCSCSSETEVFSQDLVKPFRSFSLLNGCLLPSFLITINPARWAFSYVVNLLTHLMHSLLLLTVLSETLESSTLVSSLLQKGQIIICTHKIWYEESFFKAWQVVNQKKEDFKTTKAN